MKMIAARAARNELFAEYAMRFMKGNEHADSNACGFAGHDIVQAGGFAPGMIGHAQGTF